MDGRDPSEREPAINPAGWVVRAFTLEQLSSALRDEVDVQLHKCLDVPVTYVDGARLITDTIRRVDADVAISFGVGANSGADADVESTCSNVMDDDNASPGDDRGPFQLPPEWPPEGSRGSWSEADRAWLMRYPDNAGVSYNGAPIDPEGPDTLTSLLPVAKIVERVKAENLRAIDGGWGPGRYICNNVMYRVIQAQAERERLGGFIHLNSWSESRREAYLKVVACAIEESVRAFLDAQAAAAEEGLPPPPRAEVEVEVEPEVEVEVAALPSTP
jgi:pyrrolidone-carboxylate peptidase